MELGLSLGLGRREEEEEEEEERRSCGDPSVQLSLVPFVPAPRHLSASCSQLGFPWSSTDQRDLLSRGMDVNRIPTSLSEAEDGTARAVSGSPNSTGGEGEAERASSRASDEEENGNSRKKLRLSKEQSAFLEESFKEHNTLNPKQKVALAKQLNLRPRQVEVWFQNRRARTKLKQTEVDCEYLKRCCETLTEENRRLQKELSELRALKTPSHPFFMQLPATTLSMCPSCERTTTTTTTTTSTTTNPNANHPNAGVNGSVSANAGGHQSGSKGNVGGFGSLFGTTKPRFYPFAPHPATSPAS